MWTRFKARYSTQQLPFSPRYKNNVSSHPILLGCHHVCRVYQRRQCFPSCTSLCPLLAWCLSLDAQTLSQVQNLHTHSPPRFWNSDSDIPLLSPLLPQDTRMQCCMSAFLLTARALPVVAATALCASMTPTPAPPRRRARAIVTTCCAQLGIQLAPCSPRETSLAKFGTVCECARFYVLFSDHPPPCCCTCSRSRARPASYS